MQLLTTLLLAHLFADFPLQTNGLAKLKKESLLGVFLHVLVYVIITALFLADPLRYWELIGALGIVHFLIDALKTRYKQTFEPYYFVFDQCLHFLSIAFATYLALLYYQQPPATIVPFGVVTVALVCALLLALMVFCWVWVNSLTEERETSDAGTRAAHWSGADWLCLRRSNLPMVDEPVAGDAEVIGTSL
jgi:hypothetical protein